MFAPRNGTSSCRRRMVCGRRSSSSISQSCEASRSSTAPGALRLFFRSISDERLRVLEQALRGAQLWRQAQQVQVVRLFNPGGQPFSVTPAAILGFKASEHCRATLRQRSGDGDPLCTEQTPLCCVRAWWGGDSGNIFPHIRCTHVDVYDQRCLEANEDGTCTRRRAAGLNSSITKSCEGSPSNYLTQMAILAQIAQLQTPAYAVLLEDDALPVPHWEQRLQRFFEAAGSACSWDVALLSGVLPGDHQGTAAYMVHSSYAATLHRFLGSLPVGSVDVVFTGVRLGRRRYTGVRHRPGGHPLPRIISSKEPIFAPRT